jgi:hypothetical protein
MPSPSVGSTSASCRAATAPPNRIIGEVWAEERHLLTTVPRHLLKRFAGEDTARPVLHVIDAAQRQLGDQVEVRPLSAYEVAL